jgi:hypothetical protein
MYHTIGKQRGTPGNSGPTRPTIADILRDVEPMGDLDRFAIYDLTPADEDEFFRILKDV